MKIRELKDLKKNKLYQCKDSYGTFVCRIIRSLDEPIPKVSFVNDRTRVPAKVVVSDCDTYHVGDYISFSQDHCNMDEIIEL